MLGAAALTLAGCLQQEMGTQWQRVLLALCFLRPRHGRALSALLCLANPGGVVTLAFCLTSRGNDGGRASPPSVLSRKAQLKKVVRALAANTAHVWGKGSHRDAFA